MDMSQLSADWSDWIAPLQEAFPHVKIPAIFPRAVLGDTMVERIAQNHELTTYEVREVIGDLVLKQILLHSEQRKAA